jgi:hypothetical protein
MRKLVVALFVLMAIAVLLSAGPSATAHSETTVADPAQADAAASTWRILMIVFRETDTDYMGLDARIHHMHASLADGEIDAMLTSFTGPVASAVREWSAGAVQWQIDVRYASKPITRLSSPDPYGKQWLDPDCIRDVIDSYSPDGVYDQVMVYWTSSDGSAIIPSWGWGLALPSSPSQGWGYLTVTAVRASRWNPSVADIWGQVWIHEWLHCACAFYASRGYPMPIGDADGGGYHGYPEGLRGLPGWAAYYSDLMQGRVLEGSQGFGIAREAWLSGSIAVRTTPTTSSATSTTLPKDQPFSDIVSSPYRQAVEALAGAGIINGYDDGTFRPATPVSRQQFAKMLVLALGVPVSEGDVCTFKDVVTSGSSSFYPDNYIAVAAAHGITKGMTASTFAPDSDIARAQVISMMVRAAETLRKGSLTFPYSSWRGTLPLGDATHGTNVRNAEYNGLLGGISLSGWDIWSDASREEVAQMLWNLRQM